MTRIAASLALGLMIVAATGCCDKKQLVRCKPCVNLAKMQDPVYRGPVPLTPTASAPVTSSRLTADAVASSWTSVPAPVVAPAPVPVPAAPVPDTSSWAGKLPPRNQWVYPKCHPCEQQQQPVVMTWEPTPVPAPVYEPRPAPVYEPAPAPEPADPCEWLTSQRMLWAR